MINENNRIFLSKYGGKHMIDLALEDKRNDSSLTGNPFLTSDHIHHMIDNNPNSWIISDLIRNKNINQGHLHKIMNYPDIHDFVRQETSAMIKVKQKSKEEQEEMDRPK